MPLYGCCIPLAGEGCARDCARRRVSERNRRKAALGAEITQEGETGEAPPVADEASLFRGWPPVFVGKAHGNRLGRRCIPAPCGAKRLFRHAERDTPNGVSLLIYNNRERESVRTLSACRKSLFSPRGAGIHRRPSRFPPLGLSPRQEPPCGGCAPKRACGRSPAHTLYPQGVCGIRKAAQPLTAALPYRRGEFTTLSAVSTLF